MVLDGAASRRRGRVRVEGRRGRQWHALMGAGNLGQDGNGKRLHGTILPDLNSQIMRQLKVYIYYERAASGRPSNKYSGTGYPSVWSAVNKPSSARCHEVIAKATQPPCCNSDQEYVDPVDEHKHEAHSVCVCSLKDPKYPTVKSCRTATCRIDAGVDSRALPSDDVDILGLPSFQQSSHVCFVRFHTCLVQTQVVSLGRYAAEVGDATPTCVAFAHLTWDSISLLVSISYTALLCRPVEYVDPQASYCLFRFVLIAKRSA